MDKAFINDAELEYHVTGIGEPVLLVGTGPIADSFLPFLSQEGVADRHTLIHYRQRERANRKAGSTPVSFAQHASDARALIEQLGMRKVHVAGHSTGAAISLQMAMEFPEVVHTLTLLEPPLLGAPSAGLFFERAAPAIGAYASGDGAKAMACFLSVVSGLEWEACRRVIEKHIPGGASMALDNADNFFGSYLPALQTWNFGSREAGSISRPVLSVLGAQTEPLFAEGNGILRSWFPRMEECNIARAGHLLHMQEPELVTSCVAAFLARHPIDES
jgi:3-oxoadipate enol-lactonase